MSGLYISGMEMPTDGGTIVVYKINGQFFAARAGKNELFPLVSVQNHGRLGDLGVLREVVGEAEQKAMEEYYELSDAEKECEYEMGVWDGIHMAAKILSTAPTIIPSSKQEVDK